MRRRISSGSRVRRTHSGQRCSFDILPVRLQKMHVMPGLYEHRPPTYLQHQRRATRRSRARRARPPQGVDGRGGRCSNRRRSAAKRIATERRLDRPSLRCIGQYDPRVVAPQTEAVELNAELVERAQREADKRGITLKQFVDDALKRWLATHHSK